MENQKIDIETVSFQLILHGGDAKSHAMEAMYYAKEGDFEKSDSKLEEANVSIAEAHKQQTTLIQTEAGGEDIPIKLLLIHAQDHLMNAITTIDLAREIIELHKRLSAIGVEDKK